MSGDGKLNKTTECWEGGRRGEGKAGGRVRSKERGRKEFVTNEERKAARNREGRDKGGYYKGAMCHLVCEICGLDCHTHTRIQLSNTGYLPEVCVCAYLSLCDEMRGDGGVFYYFITIHTHTHDTQDGHLNNSACLRWSSLAD